MWRYVRETYNLRSCPGEERKGDAEGEGNRRGGKLDGRETVAEGNRRGGEPKGMETGREGYRSGGKPEGRETGAEESRRGGKPEGRENGEAALRRLRTTKINSLCLNQMVF